jgi:hypothetical protein
MVVVVVVVVVDVDQIKIVYDSNKASGSMLVLTLRMIYDFTKNLSGHWERKQVNSELNELIYNKNINNFITLHFNNDYVEIRICEILRNLQMIYIDENLKRCHFNQTKVLADLSINSVLR